MRRQLGFFAPSGFLPDAGVPDRAAAQLAAAGWSVSAGDSVFARDLRFAGPDELRLSDLHRFACDPGLDVAVAARGGYGLTRLLDRIDFDAIARRRPILTGYSDFTAFNSAFLARAGGVSFQGPAASDFAAEPGSAGAANAGSFLRAIENPAYAIEFAAGGPATLQARGRLWGGNLAMLCSLLGTPWFPRVRGGILFLEDVNESAYRVERMLLQLHQAGALAGQKAILLGDFTAVPELSSDNGFGLEHALGHVAQCTDTAWVTGLPFGHGPRRCPLAVGAMASLELRHGKARLVVQGHPVVRAGGDALGTA
jgi:muramoyltetrapeptide carboxypeptidase